jgi:flavodoxin
LRVLIVYYSKTGNTEVISNAIKETLKPSHEVDVLRIEMVKEYSSSLPHLNPRIFFDTVMDRKPSMRSTIDISSYDLVFVGAPNWYGRVAPPVGTFIESITEANGKKAVVFVSSGLGRKSYADDLGNKLEGKGFKVLKKLSLTREEISGSQLKEITELLT